MVKELNVKVLATVTNNEGKRSEELNLPMVEGEWLEFLAVTKPEQIELKMMDDSDPLGVSEVINTVHTVSDFAALNAYITYLKELTIPTRVLYKVIIAANLGLDNAISYIHGLFSNLILDAKEYDVEKLIYDAFGTEYDDFSELSIEGKREVASKILGMDVIPHDGGLMLYARA